MKRREIKQYALGWYPGSNRARVALTLDDGTRHEVPVETAAELAAIAAILGQKPVFLYSTGLIASGAEEMTEKK